MGQAAGAREGSGGAREFGWWASVGVVGVGVADRGTASSYRILVAVQ